MFDLAGLALALAGPGILALVFKPNDGHLTVRNSVPGLLEFLLLMSSVAAIAFGIQSLSLPKVGFSGSGWWSLPAGLALAAFFIFMYGPIAAKVLAVWSNRGFASGTAPFLSLPRWYLWLTIVVVAGGEEWLYRGYAIERLEALTGSAAIAAAISLGAFALAHLPLWGLSISATMIVSGAIFTGLYIWSRDVLLLIIGQVLTDLYGIGMARHANGGAHAPPLLKR